MNTVIYFLNNLVQQMSITFYFHQIGKPKKRFFITMLIMLSAIAAEYAVSYLFFPKLPMIFQYLLKFVINFWVYCMLYSGRLLHRFLQHMSFYVIALFCEFVSYYHLRFTFSAIPVSEYFLVNDSYVIAAGRLMAADMLVIMLLTAAIIYKLKMARNEMYGSEVREYIVICFFVLSHLGYLTLFYRSSNREMRDINNLIQLAYQLLFMSLVFVQYYNNRRTNELIRAEQELEMLKVEMDSNYRYYRLADAKFDEISKLRHDIQNQIGTIRYLMKTDEGIEQASSIMESIAKQLERTGQRSYCQNKMLDSVLSAKLSEERFSGFDIRTDLDDGSGILSIHELCTLVCDLIDMAAEGCAVSGIGKGAYLALGSKSRGDGLVITAEASPGADGQRTGAGEQRPSPAVRSICKKYGGVFTSRCDNGVMYYIAEIKSRADV